MTRSVFFLTTLLLITDIWKKTEDCCPVEQKQYLMKFNATPSGLMLPSWLLPDQFLSCFLQTFFLYYIIYFNAFSLLWVIVQNNIFYQNGFLRIVTKFVRLYYLERLVQTERLDAELKQFRFQLSDKNGSCSN